MTIGIDAKLKILSGDQGYDIQIGPDGDVQSEESLDTAILVSLFTDRRVSESEQPNEYKRRGWIGNESTPGIQMGSKVWLYEQARITNTTLSGIADAATDCLQWMVEQGIAKNVSASASSTSTGVSLNVTITRPTSEVEQRFYDLWNNTATGQVVEISATPLPVPAPAPAPALAPFTANTNSIRLHSNPFNSWHMDSDPQTLGFTIRKWSFSSWYKAIDSNINPIPIPGSANSYRVVFRTVTHGSTAGAYTINVFQFPNRFEIYVQGIHGAVYKKYKVKPVVGSDLVVNQWYHIGATFDGETDIQFNQVLRVWIDGVEMTGANLVKTTDLNTLGVIGAGQEQSIQIGPGPANYYSLAIWDDVLPPSEMVFNYGSGGEFDLLSSVYSLNLHHWYRLYNDINSLGHNYANIGDGNDITNFSAYQAQVDSPISESLVIPNLNSVQFGRTQWMGFSSDQAMGIGNAWSFSLWFSPTDVSGSLSHVFTVKGPGSITNYIRVVQTTDYFNVYIADTTNALFKSYRISSNPGNPAFVVGQWYNLGATWDGTTLKTWLDGVEATIGGTPSLVETLNNAGTMSDTSRNLYITSGAGTTGNTGEGRMYSLALWGTTLVPADMVRVYGGGSEFDVGTNESVYMQSNSLTSWYRFGAKSGADIGKNYAPSGITSSLVSLGTDPVTDSDIVIDKP